MIPALHPAASAPAPKIPARLIAHRVFDDGAPLGAASVADLDRFDGIELDIRCGEDGEPHIEHAPVFRLRSRRKRVPQRFDAALEFLSARTPELRTVLLDLKSAAAADGVGRLLARNPPPFETVFNCWHAADVAALRRRLPSARVLFAVAPIFARRAPRGRLRDLYLCNSYPFLHHRRGYRPPEGKANGHGINVKLISTRRLSAFLPPAVDGLCVHRLFCNADLLDFARARGLGLAVYGLDPDKPERIARVAAFADYAIVSRPRKRRLRLAPPQAMAA
ncbi:MAG: hypothetical protein R6V44_15110 [Paracoccaceae bacterium]